MKRFTDENTEGYTIVELEHLNRRVEALLGDDELSDADEIQDLCEWVLASHDTERSDSHENHS